MQARGRDYLTEDGPGPGFFPLWYGIGILACSASYDQYTNEMRTIL